MYQKAAQFSFPQETKQEQQQMLLERTLGDGNISLGQLMTPVQDPDYDSNSLKRSELVTK